MQSPSYLDQLIQTTISHSATPTYHGDEKWPLWGGEVILTDYGKSTLTPIPAGHDEDRKPTGNETITTAMCEIAMVPRNSFNRVGFNISHAQIESLAMLSDTARRGFQDDFDQLVQYYILTGH
jgi:hypothetical protein